MREFKLLNAARTLSLGAGMALAQSQSLADEVGASRPTTDSYGTEYYSAPYATPLGNEVGNAIAGAIIGGVASAIINNMNTGSGYSPPSYSNGSGSYVDRMHQQSRNRLNRNAARSGLPCEWFIQQANGNWSALPDRCR